MRTDLDVLSFDRKDTHMKEYDKMNKHFPIKIKDLYFI